MTERLLVEHCAPTLAGLKTAGLINIAYETQESARCEVCRLNRLLAAKGVRIIPLRYQKGRMLLYVYRPAMLKKDLEDERARSMLCEQGYVFDHVDCGVAQLAKRMKQEKGFPHEVGLFLGYPPEDVFGFIHHREKGCKCVGEWRVYGDEGTAKKAFARYKKCKDVYRSLFSSGRSVESLTVKASA